MNESKTPTKLSCLRQLQEDMFTALREGDSLTFQKLNDLTTILELERLEVPNDE